MAYIDCDLYESCRDVLCFLSGKMEHGAVLVFDDYYCFYGDPQRGEQRAFHEWKQRNSDWTFVPFLRFGWFGMSFLVHHKNRIGREG